MAFGEGFSQVLQAARLGAEWAWREIYTDLAPSILGYVSRRGAPEPEDVTAQVFLQMVNGIQTFQGTERDFRSWTFTIAHGHLVDALRSKNDDLTEPIEGIADGLRAAGDAESEAFERIHEKEIRQLLGSLAPDQADVLLLRLLGQMTIDEIAAALGKSRGAVKALQRRGLSALRREISLQGVPL